jgi:nucleotide-binding universal stress UspA family protein
MKVFKKWLVGLDLTSADGHLIRYVIDLGQILKPQSIHFFHVVKEADEFRLPYEGLQVLKHQIFSEKKLEIEFRVNQQMKNTGLNYTYEVLEGNVVEEIAYMVKNKDIDLVIVGKRRMTSGQGTMSEQISRKMNCHFLMVPEGAACRLDRIVLATDFSDHAHQALELAGSLHEMQQKANILATHVYQVPAGYYKIGKSYSEFALITRQNAERNMKEFLKDFNHPVESHYLLRNTDSVSEVLLNHSNREKADIIVMGSKGQTAASLALLGSVTLKLLRLNQSTPVLTVKKEGETLGLLQAIGRL